jgi:hypothetical protein
MRHVRSGLGLSLLALILAAIQAPTSADEHYFALTFGSQSHPKQLRYTHTWATIVRAVGTGPDLSTYQLFVHTISWYPASRNVRVWALRPEKGVNMTLEETLAEVYKNGESVNLWGPFVLTKDVYDRSLRVYGALMSGRVQYRAISTNADLYIADCIHAVAAVDPMFGRGHYPLIRIGKPASRFIARELVIRSLEHRGIDQAAYRNDWLIPRLGLNRFPMNVVPPCAIPKRSCVLCCTPP